VFWPDTRVTLALELINRQGAEEEKAFVPCSSPSNPVASAARRNWKWKHVERARSAVSVQPIYASNEHRKGWSSSGSVVRVRASRTATTASVLDRHGFVERRGRARRARLGQRPNELWCTDYKGEFLLGNALPATENLTQ